MTQTGKIHLSHPPLPKESEVNQPAITILFTKQPSKQAARETQEAERGEEKGKKKLTNEQTKPEPKKMVPKNSTRASPSSPHIDGPTHAKKDDTLTPAMPVAQEEKSKRQAVVGSHVQEKTKGKELGEGSAIVKAKAKQANQE